LTVLYYRQFSGERCGTENKYRLNDVLENEQKGRIGRVSYGGIPRKAENIK
jgi:hypothetical protein